MERWSSGSVGSLRYCWPKSSVNRHEAPLFSPVAISAARDRCARRRDARRQVPPARRRSTPGVLTGPRGHPPVSLQLVAQLSQAPRHPGCPGLPRVHGRPQSSRHGKRRTGVPRPRGWPCHELIWAEPYWEVSVVRMLAHQDAPPTASISIYSVSTVAAHAGPDRAEGPRSGHLSAVAGALTTVEPDTAPPVPTPGPHPVEGAVPSASAGWISNSSRPAPSARKSSTSATAWRASRRVRRPM